MASEGRRQNLQFVSCCLSLISDYFIDNCVEYKWNESRIVLILCLFAILQLIMLYFYIYFLFLYIQFYVFLCNIYPIENSKKIALFFENSRAIFLKNLLFNAFVLVTAV